MVGAKNRMFNTPGGKIVTVQDALKAGVITADQLPNDKEGAAKLAASLSDKDKAKVTENASERLGYKVNSETIKTANQSGLLQSSNTTKTSESKSKDDRLREQAYKLEKEAYAQIDRTVKEGGRLGGEPVKVGHHSEGKHRRFIRQMDRQMEQANAKLDRAKELRSKADSAEAGAKRRAKTEAYKTGSIQVNKGSYDKAQISSNFKARDFSILKPGDKVKAYAFQGRSAGLNIQEGTIKKVNKGGFRVVYKDGKEETLKTLGMLDSLTIT